MGQGSDPAPGVISPGTVSTGASETDRMGRCARAAWDHAVEQYRKRPYQRPGVTTAHVLLGVLREEKCAGGLILRKLGLDLELAYATTEFVLQYGRRAGGAEESPVLWGGVPHTPAGKSVLDFAREEANLFRPTYPIGTEHLVLGVLRTPEGMGCRLLNYFGIEGRGARAARDVLWDVLRSAE